MVPMLFVTRLQAHRPLAIPSGTPTISAISEKVVACHATTPAHLPGYEPDRLQDRKSAVDDGRK